MYLTAKTTKLISGLLRYDQNHLFLTKTSSTLLPRSSCSSL